MGKPSIRPGFRFKPTDVELVRCYLKNKLLGKKLDPDVIAVVNLYDFNPWDLPDKSILSGDREWYFISPRSKKYISGPRMNRATETGYWKATGKDKKVKNKKGVVAMRKTLVFHMGHSPKGIRTNWVMHEFRMTDKDFANQGVDQEAYVICRVFEKSGFGPKNGENYGAPFEEKEWDDVDDDDEKSSVTSLMMIGVLVNTKNVSGSSMMNMTVTEPGPSTITYLENEGPTVTDVPVNNNTQEIEDRKGKKVMTIPVNGNDELVNDDFMLTFGDLDSLLCNSDTQERTKVEERGERCPQLELLKNIRYPFRKSNMKLSEIRISEIWISEIRICDISDSDTDFRKFQISDIRTLFIYQIIVKYMFK